MNHFHKNVIRIAIVSILFLSYAIDVYGDTIYTQYLSEQDLDSSGDEPNPSDPHWTENLWHIIAPGCGLYWQGSSADGD